jgi:SAM-dependent methyltransferase
MQDYYNRRAAEYEEVYRRDEPARKAELSAITTAMQQALAGRRVLEVACGTGFWTERAAAVARHIVATDASREMLQLARAKGMPAEVVEFRLADAYSPDDVEGEFDAALANFWLSHVPRSRLAEFLDGLHARLGAGDAVFMADNVFVPGLGGELVRPAGTDDTYKLRTLSDGSEHLVLKNYYAEGELAAIFEGRASALEVTVGRCYWWLRYVCL